MTKRILLRALENDVEFSGPFTLRPNGVGVTHFRCDPHQIPLIQTAGCPEPGGHVRAHGGRHVHFAQTLPNEPLRLLFKHAQDVLFGFYTAGSPLPHDNHPDLLKGALTLRQAG